MQPGAHAPYEIDLGARVCFVVENAAEVALSVALFDCATSGRVLLLGEKRVPRLAKHVFWFGDTLGTPFTAGLPDDRRVGVDRIAAIATTRPDVSLGYLERRKTFAEILAPPIRAGPRRTGPGRSRRATPGELDFDADGIADRPPGLIRLLVHFSSSM